GGVIEQPVNGLKAQVAHGHRVDLGVDQGHGPAGPPVPQHCASFLGQDFFQTCLDLGGHGGEARRGGLIPPLPSFAAKNQGRDHSRPHGKRKTENVFLSRPSSGKPECPARFPHIGGPGGRCSSWRPPPPDWPRAGEWPAAPRRSGAALKSAGWWGSPGPPTVGSPESRRAV